MAKLRETFERMFRRWTRKQRPAFTYAKVRIVESMSDVPTEIGWEIFVVRRDSLPRWVVLQCPCRCGERLNVNLMRSAKPHWTLSLKRGKASLSPSLWVSTSRCGSHFWLVDNGVFWAPRRSIES
jgi:hypothetical protein